MHRRCAWAAAVMFLVAGGCARYAKPAASEWNPDESDAPDVLPLPAVEQLSLPSGGRAVRFRYQSGNVYRVFSAPGWLTSLAFEPGESIRNINIGDADQWELRKTTSGGDGKEIQHVLVTPRQSGVRTTLIVATTRRAYPVELRADEARKMTFVQWDTRPPSPAPVQSGPSVGSWSARPNPELTPDGSELTCHP